MGMLGAVDERIERGMRRHFSDFRANITAGAQRLGYKVAFNAPAAQKRLGIANSLVLACHAPLLAEPV